MFDKKPEILILFVLMIFSIAGVAAALDINTIAEINIAGGGMEVPPTSALAVKKDEMLSSVTAKTFYDIGYELYMAKDADILSARQAIIFFNAAISLDNRAGFVLPDIINIAWQWPDENFSDAVRLALNEYIGRSSDLEVSSKAVGYLLEKLDTREQRQDLLMGLLNQFGEKNIMFASDILTQLGLLTAETGDWAAAQGYLAQAFSDNKFNRLAFAKLAEVAEKSGQPLPDIYYLQNLRFAVRANPLDLTSALRFAQYAQVLTLYAPAAAAYKYSVDLLKYLGGPNSVGLDIYKPYLLNSYNARQFSQCRQILQDIRDKGVFDVQSEAIAAAAARTGGDKQSYKTIIDGIESRSVAILSGRLRASAAELADLTWFYSFVADVNSEIVLTWATKAYDADANSLNAASLFAYALATNNQPDLAAGVLEKIGTAVPSAMLAKAIVLEQKQDANSAADLLKKAAETAAGSFEAQKAREKLKALGVEYQFPVDAAAITIVLQNDFGQSFFPQFVEPEKMVSIQFNIKGSVFSYDSEIIGNLVIMNKSTEPMVISPDAMLKGSVRVDAKITGDLTSQFPALIVKTVRPSYEIKPDDALFIPLRLDTGPLKALLDTHPQAQLTIEYTAYVDPLIDPNDRVVNALYLKPAGVVINRRALDLNTHYLQQRLDTLKRGHPGQKVKSADLFAGLLAEQQLFRQTGPAYRFVYAEPQVLSSAIAKCLAEDDWALKVQTIAAMLRIKLDYSLTQAVSEELGNPNWPVRLIAVFILDKNQKQEFKPVLTWTAENDSNPMVKELAAILSGNPLPAHPKPVVPDNNEANLPDSKSAN